MIDDKILGELNAFHRIEAMTKFFEEKFLENEEVL